MDVAVVVGETSFGSSSSRELIGARGSKAVCSASGLELLLAVAGGMRESVLSVRDMKARAKSENRRSLALIEQTVSPESNSQLATLSFLRT